ncbi:hypothetical protein MYSTI_05745 [Myxococcus stipitatus DSM 14675]|uniref:Uncharacterized protein n=1 Tax=Myxococcus stipitatus (strain DSM 14675 / JCM 12634 / Mx s8) TaxID=1278073 RepID=L7UDN1_MYXSD|nr:hypothetical protein [Myxococcus stipitatus]AGC47021.1 hypothetical protein MYSTI_05745 [Myxococcus stipitatus DSM 14675]
MAQSSLKGLLIRTAVVRLPGLGYIYAADPKKEKRGVPHTVTFRFKDGVLTRGDANYDAHSLALIAKPELGLVSIAGNGYYSVITAQGSKSGDIFSDSTPAPPTPRISGIRSVSSVEGEAYALGLRGIVYRLTGLKSWARIDEGLPDTFNGQALDGFSAGDLYAVGREGALWQLEGAQWTRREPPTSATLTAVKCAGNGQVYVAGHGGVLLEGRGDSWRAIPHGGTEDNIWDLEWFQDRLYVSTLSHVYRLEGERLEAVNFGADPPKSCYQLSASEGVMWSNGEKDILSFDGTQWTRVV